MHRFTGIHGHVGVKMRRDNTSGDHHIDRARTDGGVGHHTPTRPAALLATGGDGCC